MDKFYVKPKRSLKAVQNSSGTTAETSRNSPAVCPSAGAHNRASGVGKFYSRIRHTIEDNLTPKISGKLYKAGKHSKSMTALSSLDSSIGKYTLTNKNSQPLENKKTTKEIRPNVTKTVSLSTPTPSQNTPSISSYFAQRPSSYVESDEDENQLSLNFVKTSLEDEIFEELEKVAHDECKLNAVLKTFDKIVFDYNDPLPQTKSSDNVQDEKKPLESSINIDSPVSVEEPKQTIIAIPTVDNVGDKKSTIEELPVVQQQNQPPPPQTDCRHQNTANKLQKSSSCLSLTRRKCYQSPDSPCLRQMRHIFIQQQKQKSKSVWELSNSTKIPILKTMPLQKRSKSFCYLNTNTTTSTSTEAVNDSIASKCAKAVEAQEVVAIKKASTAKPMKRTAKYVNVKPTIKTSDPPSSNSTATGQMKRDTKAKSRTTEQNPAAPRRTNSNSSLSNKKHVSTVMVPPTPPRRSRTSDELLDKCLEKGQQILRKVESLNTSQQRGGALTTNNKSVVRIKSSTGGNKTATLRRKKFQHKLNYANEDKILPPSLESCKIIPPDFAENSNKHAELLVNVVQVNNAIRSLPQRQISTDSGIATVSNLNSLDFVPSTVSLKTKEHESSSCSDSDDSGHISNENMEITNNHQPSNSSSTTSLNDDTPAVTIKNAEMTEDDTKRELFITTNQRVCTTCRIAQVESVKVIRTHVEIFPNFTKEVTIRLQ
ncbi:uncharacterized protein [Musca autumnalis]|uniref:uncharacterized protein n=1 Tax=Musca autumnalis TaxID=221902 RepID=UPI003CF705D7